jgi:hypothetical protein
VQAKRQFRRRLEHLVSFRSKQLMSTGPKTACTYKYTCFQALTGVLHDEHMTNPAIRRHSQHGFKAISPNQTALPTNHRGKPVPDSMLAKRPTPRHFNNLRTSRALPCSAFQQTQPTDLSPQQPTHNCTNRKRARPNQGSERKLTPC